jgi:hypothetical protein
MTRRLQWIAVAAVGCVGLGDVSGDDARSWGQTSPPSCRSNGGQRCHGLERRGLCCCRQRCGRSSNRARGVKLARTKMAGDTSLRRRLRWAL